MEFDGQDIAPIVFQLFKTAALIAHRIFEELPQAALTESQVSRTNIPIDFDPHDTHPLLSFNSRTKTFGTEVTNSMESIAERHLSSVAAAPCTKVQILMRRR
jgi:hypothetical protein